MTALPPDAGQPEARAEHGGHDVWGLDFGQVGWHQPEPAPPVAAALEATQALPGMESLAPVPAEGGAAIVAAPEGILAKLVRDKIPALIRSRGLEPVTRTAADAELPALLRDKLREETAEFLASGDPAELADVLEVVYALAGLAGITAGELEGMRAAKAEERGTFAGRVVWTGNRSSDEEVRDA